MHKISLKERKCGLSPLKYINIPIYLNNSSFNLYKISINGINPNRFVNIVDWVRDRENRVWWTVDFIDDFIISNNEKTL